MFSFCSHILFYTDGKSTFQKQNNELPHIFQTDTQRFGAHRKYYLWEGINSPDRVFAVYWQKSKYI